MCGNRHGYGRCLRLGALKFGGVFDALYDEPGSIYIANRLALAIISFPVPVLVKRLAKA